MEGRRPEPGRAESHGRRRVAAGARARPGGALLPPRRVFRFRGLDPAAPRRDVPVPGPRGRPAHPHPAHDRPCRGPRSVDRPGDRRSRSPRARGCAGPGGCLRAGAAPPRAHRARTPRPADPVRDRAAGPPHPTAVVAAGAVRARLRRGDGPQPPAGADVSGADDPAACRGAAYTRAGLRRAAGAVRAPPAARGQGRPRAEAAARSGGRGAGARGARQPRGRRGRPRGGARRPARGRVPADGAGAGWQRRGRVPRRVTHAFRERGRAGALPGHCRVVRHPTGARSVAGPARFRRSGRGREWASPVAPLPRAAGRRRRAGPARPAHTGVAHRDRALRRPRRVDPGGAARAGRVDGAPHRRAAGAPVRRRPALAVRRRRSPGGRPLPQQRSEPDRVPQSRAGVGGRPGRAAACSGAVPRHPECEPGRVFHGARRGAEGGGGRRRHRPRRGRAVAGGAARRDRRADARAVGAPGSLSARRVPAGARCFRSSRRRPSHARPVTRSPSSPT